MRLYDLARSVRSKNAGPFRLTIDVMFADADAFQRAADAEGMRPERIAELYDVSADNVNVISFERILTIKVTVPRLVGSGAPGDRDVYGCGQHFPLASVEV